MIGFRREHAILRKALLRSRTGYPDTQVMGIDDSSKVLRVVFAGCDEEGQEDMVCLALKRWRFLGERQELYLPSLLTGMGWKIAADTGKEYLKAGILEDGALPLAGQQPFHAGKKSDGAVAHQL
ncbi:MAG: hypothetical protein V8S42_09365 [Lachnospiraceae bacterium]